MRQRGTAFLGLLAILAVGALGPAAADAACIIKHVWQSPSPDGSDPLKLQPSYWNDCHAVQLGVHGNLLVRDTGDATYGTAWSDGLTYLAKTLALAQGTLASPAPAWSSTATWNNAGVTFTHWLVNITDTASGAGSRVFDFQIGGTSLLKLDKAGNLLLGVGAPGAGLTKGLALGIGTCPSAAAVDTVQVCAEDQNGPGTAGLRLRDEQGNVFSIGPVLGSAAAYDLTSQGVQASFLISGGATWIGSRLSHPLRLMTADTDRVTIDTAGNVGLGTTTFGTSAAKVLAFGQGTAPTTSPADTVQLWVADVGGAGTAGLTVRDETNNRLTFGRITGWDTGALEITNGTVTASLASIHNNIVWMGSRSSHPLRLMVADTDRAHFDTSGNFGLGTTSFGANAAKALALGLGTCPTTSPVDVVQFCVEDHAGAGTAGLTIRSETGALFQVGGIDVNKAKLRVAPNGSGFWEVRPSATSATEIDTATTQRYMVGASDRLWLGDDGNIRILTDQVGASAVGVIAYGLATAAPTTSPADVVQVWVADVGGAGTASMWWRTETGQTHALGRLLYVNAGSSVTHGRVGGTLNIQTGAVGTPASTAETALFTYSLPANTLAVNGQRVRVRVWGTTAANSNNKTIRTYFGVTVVSTIGPIALNNGTWMVEAEVVRTGAATQEALVFGGTSTLGMAPARTAPTETLSNAITVKVTGQNGTASANDIVAHGFDVVWLPD